MDIEASKVDIEASKVDIEASKVDIEASKVDIEVPKVDIEKRNINCKNAGTFLPFGDSYSMKPAKRRRCYFVSYDKRGICAGSAGLYPAYVPTGIFYSE